jgi:hypothetical protein
MKSRLLLSALLATGLLAGGAHQLATNAQEFKQGPPAKGSWSQGPVSKGPGGGQTLKQKGPSGPVWKKPPADKGVVLKKPPVEKKWVVKKPPKKPPVVIVDGDRKHRPWRHGLKYRWIIVPTIVLAEELDWCHYHLYPVRGMRYHRSVQCHQHVLWNHPSIRYVEAY